MTIIVVRRDDMPGIHDVRIYSLAEAKARFSRVVEEAQSEDVVITRNGSPVVVIIDYEKYEKLSRFVEEVHDVFLLDIGDPLATDMVGEKGIKKMLEDE